MQFLHYYGDYYPENATPPFVDYLAYAELSSEDAFVFKYRVLHTRRNRCLASYINHGASNPNCSLYFTDDNAYVYIEILRTIEAGEQLLADYGEGYWNGRNKQNITIVDLSQPQ